MVQNNKVLTVSYGTFSCTLEGFEDSFDTMKAIAEYFRDLAADDRYFGAEPPQPDADMLARIAQREIARQVEARTSDTGIHLRAATSTPLPPVPADDLPADDAGLSDADVSSEAEPATPEAVTPEAATPEEELQAPRPDAPTPDPSKIAAISAAVAAHAAEAQAVETQDEAEAAETDDTDAATAQDAEERELQETEAEPVTPAAHKPSDSESIAAKLRRIRAVVAKSPEPEEDFSEDEHADSILPDSAAPEASVDTSAEPAEAPDPAEEQIAEAETPPEAASATHEDDEISRVLSQLSAEKAEATAAEAKAEAPEPPAEQSAAEPEKTAPRRRARIVKVKRADLEQAVASGALEEASKPAEPEFESSLSDEDEDDLMRELAAVEADLLAASSEPEAETPAADQETANQEAASGEEIEDTKVEAVQTPSDSGRPERPAPDLADRDVSRLMAAADEKLGAPETASSRETYNQLRAAVAAAQADGSAGAAGDGEDSKAAYRKDLADVVKPRRPRVRGDREARKPVSTGRPAPLKLVAEQRIDPMPAAQESAAPKAPVRPRRISVLSQDKRSAEEAQAGFAAYVRDCGAVELPDLLEAAAAYMSFVEGRDFFSRPQLMNAVRRTGAAEFNREDGLRSFGQLLREGKIERSENGHFVATEDIGFRPAKRAAG
ncbi:chemotaxis protein CheA [Phaeobacter sp. QD34_3]|uniref:chemotaxis protein CheA n=1 Tax=unclassified Phaeobacter TaxID=2621772 RepID=UPI00237F4CE1|nr:MULTISPECIES: chemotaxis protein CheA [unclassified Phaeobacter]MDE4131836.1 chemotaxis protein CheA [Phaeobacter sp. QD34_3]MDE4135474.1 chemotaxis protein CheA [Phaeobacter sp. QD34_24]MDE4173463.1 chemotaxis protein CheA [Phaeobacter sp. PT47_59]